VLKVTLAQVARLAGVTHQTASPALGAKAHLHAPDTVERVLSRRPRTRISSQRCAATHRAVGIFSDNPRSAARWRACGVRYLATGVDVAMFADAASAWGRELRTPA